MECIYVELECDYKLYCDLEFDNEYNGSIFSEGYDKIERQNEKVIQMNS